MEQICPDYYLQFHCIGSACKHNCCIGWEIDIDEDTLQLYQALKGNMGHRLRQSISYDGTPHFILTDGERCPFLNDDNLCDIITELGKPCLCDICAVHPRFVNEWEGRSELGLGLCCEAAGALILSQTEPMCLMGNAPATPLTRKRDAILSLLQDRSRPVIERLYDLSPAVDARRIAARYLPLERMDQTWGNFLEQLIRDFRDDMLPPFARYMTVRDTEYEHLAVYLLYRHFSTAPDTAIDFVCQALTLLYALGAHQYHQNGKFDFADQVELCRLFSAEVEYSTENLSILIKGE